MKQKVLEILKPQVKAFGFNKEELEGVAESIANNLTSESTDEQITAAVNAAIPFLQVSQKVSTRVINEKLSKKTEEPVPGSRKTEELKKEDEDDEPAWFKKYREAQDQRFAALSAEKTAVTRRSRYEASLKDVPEKQKQVMLKDFDRISFKDDADFESFMEEKAETIKELVQESANEALAGSPIPLGGGKAKDDKGRFIEVLQTMNTPQAKTE